MVKKTSILLIASLCLNAALIGGVAAGYYAIQKPEKSSHERRDDKRGKRPPPSRNFDERLARVVFDRLDGDERKAFREALAKEWRETRGEREQQRKDRDALATVLQQDTFDRKAAEDAFSKIQDSATTMRSRLFVHLLDILEGMDDAERITLIKDLQNQTAEFEKKMRENRGKPGDKQGGPPPPHDDFGGPPPPPPEED